MSAAHCFCRDGHNGIKCRRKKIEGKWTHAIDYDPSTKVKIVAGVNNERLSVKERDPGAIYWGAKVE